MRVCVCVSVYLLISTVNVSEKKLWRLADSSFAEKRAPRIQHKRVPSLFETRHLEMALPPARSINFAANIEKMRERNGNGGRGEGVGEETAPLYTTG